MNAINAALSSFWSRGRFRHPRDLFQAGADLGFAYFELSGLRGDTFYDEIRPGDFRFVSLHDPAPPARGEKGISSKELRREDVVYTSLDEERRRRAVAITRRSIDTAAEYGARIIVLHSGQTSASPEIEEQLKKLYVAGGIASPEADALRARLATERAYQHREHMYALHRSLDELAAQASQKNVRLGLENRPTYEITNFAEMSEILAWYPANLVGYWHDTGHAEVQASLGMTAHVDWLREFCHRIVGMHLHDAVGISNHRAPGEGSVDWCGLAPLASAADAVRVIEVDETVSEESLFAGIEHLRAMGWLKNSK